MSSRWSDLFLDHRGNVVDKWEQYLQVYDDIVGVRAAQGQSISLLEIGVQNGGSLEIWSKFLPAGSKVVGLDINLEVAKLDFVGDNITVHAIDATNEQDVDSALGQSSFDVIIDDGSHRSADIIAAMEIFMPRLKPGGTYVIEDLHASYMASFGGGYALPTSAVSYLKNVVDALHCDYIDMGIFTPADRERLINFQTQVASITFYDSVAVIQTLPERRRGRYSRLLSGERANVVPISELVGSVATSATAIKLTHAGNLERWWQADLQSQIEDCRARIAALEGRAESIRSNRRTSDGDAQGRPASNPKSRRS